MFGGDLCDALGTHFELDEITSSKKALNQMWNQYKYLQLARVLGLQLSNQIKGIQIHSSALTIYNRPYTECLGDFIFKRRDNEGTHWALLGMVDAVTELQQHGVVHRNLTADNIAILNNEHSEICIKDFRFASSIKEKDIAEGLPRSNYLNKTSKWDGGSTNFNKYSIGIIILSWYIGGGRNKLSNKSKIEIEKVAKEQLSATVTPRGIKNIIRGTILEQVQLMDMESIGFNLKDIFQGTSRTDRSRANSTNV